eukprot:m.264659 g.264659  ORF g.264659 m.264659 type:complete len:1506 (-) comp54668_c0_seq1:4415-8932(-)
MSAHPDPLLEYFASSTAVPVEVLYSGVPAAAGTTTVHHTAPQDSAQQSSAESASQPSEDTTAQPAEAPPFAESTAGPPQHPHAVETAEAAQAPAADPTADELAHTPRSFTPVPVGASASLGHAEAEPTLLPETSDIPNDSPLDAVADQPAVPLQEELQDSSEPLIEQPAVDKPSSPILATEIKDTVPDDFPTPAQKSDISGSAALDPAAIVPPILSTDTPVNVLPQVVEAERAASEIQRPEASQPSADIAQPNSDSTGNTSREQDLTDSPTVSSLESTDIHSDSSQAVEAPPAPSDSVSRAVVPPANEPFTSSPQEVESATTPAQLPLPAVENSDSHLSSSDDAPAEEPKTESSVVASREIPQRPSIPSSARSSRSNPNAIPEHPEEAAAAETTTTPPTLPVQLTDAEISAMQFISDADDAVPPASSSSDPLLQNRLTLQSQSQLLSQREVASHLDSKPDLPVPSEPGRNQRRKQSVAATRGSKRDPKVATEAIDQLSGAGVLVLASKHIRSPFGDHLIAAVMSDDHILLEKLTQKPPAGAINHQDENGRTALMHACANDCTRCVSLVLNCGANVHLVDDDEQTSLHLAARCGSFSIAKILLKAGADINARDIMRRTALHWAVEANSLEMLAILLRSNSGSSTDLDIDAADVNYKTALSMATEMSLEPHIRLLLKRHASAFVRDADGQTPLHRLTHSASAPACAQALLESCPELLEARDDMGRTALSLAALHGNAPLLEFLLSHGSDVELRDNARRTPMHWAAQGRVECLKLLQAAGLQVDAVDGQAAQPVHYAARAGRNDTIQYFLVNGVSVDAVDGDGRTPLIWATLKSLTATCSALIAAGASLNHIDNLGYTPLHYAVRADDINTCRALVDAGANLNVRSKDHLFSPLFIATISKATACVAYLLDRQAEVTFLDNMGRSLLHYAANTANLSLCSALLARNVKVNHADHQGITPLHEAVLAGNIAMTLLLLKANANVHAVDQHRVQPLHDAATIPRVDCTRMLLEYGANPNVLDSAGRSPLGIAHENHNDDVARFLRGFGAMTASEMRRRACVLIQDWWRFYLMRRAHYARIRAATIIQVVFRKHLSNPQAAREAKLKELQEARALARQHQALESEQHRLLEVQRYEQELERERQRMELDARAREQAAILQLQQDKLSRSARSDAQESDGLRSTKALSRQSSKPDALSPRVTNPKPSSARNSVSSRLPPVSAASASEAAGEEEPTSRMSPVADSSLEASKSFGVTFSDSLPPIRTLIAAPGSIAPPKASKPHPAAFARDHGQPEASLRATPTQVLVLPPIHPSTSTAPTTAATAAGAQPTSPTSHSKPAGLRAPPKTKQRGWDATVSTIPLRQPLPTESGSMYTRPINFDVELPGLVSPLISQRGRILRETDFQRVKELQKQLAKREAEIQLMQLRERELQLEASEQQARQEEQLLAQIQAVQNIKSQFQFIRHTLESSAQGAPDGTSLKASKRLKKQVKTALQDVLLLKNVAELGHNSTSET